MKTAKDILLYALNNDYANRETNRLVYMNIPKNSNIVEVLQAVEEVYNIDSKEICLIATTYTAMNTAIINGYESIYLYNHLFKADDEKMYKINNGFPYGVRYFVLQSCDTLTEKMLHMIEWGAYNAAKIIICYDSMVPKNQLGQSIKNNMWKYSNYDVIKIGRDKINTSDVLYKLKNKMRPKNFDLTQFLVETNNTLPYLTINRIHELEDLLVQHNPSIPIITPNYTYLEEANSLIRNYLGFDSEKIHEGEWLITQNLCTAVINATGEKISIPMGHRFQFKGFIAPMTELYSTIKFDYMLSTSEIVECRMSIPNGIGTETDNNVRYGYVIPYHIVIDQTFQEAVVLFNPNTMYSKEVLYSCIVPIQNTLHLNIVR